MLNRRVVCPQPSPILTGALIEMTDTKGFYSELGDFYHLIYPDWEASVQRQAEVLDATIREVLRVSETVLDVSCGIGTQSLGLASRGYKVTASDLSPGTIERAKREALRRGLDISYSVADMRETYAHHVRQFDAILSCDNSMPHLLTDEDILTALKQLYLCTLPGGGYRHVAGLREGKSCSSANQALRRAR